MFESSSHYSFLPVDIPRYTSIQYSNLDIEFSYIILYEFREFRTHGIKYFGKLLMFCFVFKY